MIDFIDDNITRVRRIVLQEIIQRFYKDFTIAHNFSSDRTAAVNIIGSKSVYINNLYIEAFGEYGLYLDANTKFGVVSNCMFTRGNITDIVPKPKSYEHMARRGMAWLFNDSL